MIKNENNKNVSMNEMGNNNVVKKFDVATCITKNEQLSQKLIKNDEIKWYKRMFNKIAKLFNH